MHICNDHKKKIFLAFVPRHHRSACIIDATSKHGHNALGIEQPMLGEQMRWKIAGFSSNDNAIMLLFRTAEGNERNIITSSSNYFLIEAYY